MFHSTNLQQLMHITWQIISLETTQTPFRTLRPSPRLWKAIILLIPPQEICPPANVNSISSTLEKSTNFILLVHKARSPSVNTVANEVGLYLPSQHKVPTPLSSSLLVQNDNPLLHTVYSSSQPQLPPLVASNSTWLHAEQLALWLVKWLAIQQPASAYWNM